MKRRPLVLISLDGWGINPMPDRNPIVEGNTPTMDSVRAEYPYGVLSASGLEVGLPWGEVGNSEVGHLNLGAGLVLYQNLPRISLAIENGTFFENTSFLKAMDHVLQNDSTLHLVGLTSPGGVHAHIDHLKALVRMAKQKGISRLAIHIITDGRDSPPQSAAEYLADLEETLKQEKLGQIVSLAGRFYSMDRNSTWERTQAGYELMTQGKGKEFRSVQDALDAAYKDKLDDETLEPSVIVDRKGNPLATVGEQDAVIFFNYRPDRARQLTRAFVEKDFEEFERTTFLPDVTFVTMTEYEKDLPVDIAFAPEYITNPFGKVISEAGLKQLRIAETEKYAHVTYFFNGGQEAQYAHEDRILVPSPRVASYAEKPEMSAHEVAKKLVAEIKKEKYDFCLVNFANADMVGHTGDYKATLEAVETVDECVSMVIEANKKVHGITIITADHGNAEYVVDPSSGEKNKEHSSGVVPFMIVDETLAREKRPEEIEFLKLQINPVGILADVAPTMLDLLGIDPPPEMTGVSLLKELS